MDLKKRNKLLYSCKPVRVAEIRVLVLVVVIPIIKEICFKSV